MCWGKVFQTKHHTAKQTKRKTALHRFFFTPRGRSQTSLATIGPAPSFSLMYKYHPSHETYFTGGGCLKDLQTT
jgi:hypothetical protein